MKDFFKYITVSLLTIAAKIMLKQHKPTIVAITGSVGKTATKDAVATVLSTKYSVRKSDRSFNSEIGVPLTILDLDTAWNSVWGWGKNIIIGYYRALTQKTYPEVLVLEIGVDKPGDMAKVTSWIRPNVVILTRLPNVPVHVENFSSPLSVTKEKLILVNALTPDGTLICNIDDEQIQNSLKNFDRRVLSYARYRQSADFLISRDQTIYYDDRPTGLQFDLAVDNEKHTVLIEDAVGMQLAYIHTAAIVAGYIFSVSVPDAVKVLRTHVPPPGRMRVMKGIKGTTLIDDTYNASPVAMESALHTLNEMKYTKRKIAVLGDMLELGVYSIEQHRRIGRIASKTCDVLITVGVRSRETASSALKNGMSEKNILQYDDAIRAGRELQNMLSTGDVVLIKASQAVRAERIVEEVMLEPEKASELLCRQSKGWKSR